MPHNRIVAAAKVTSMYESALTEGRVGLGIAVVTGTRTAPLVPNQAGNEAQLDPTLGHA
jgi:hypothetical protein